MSSEKAQKLTLGVFAFVLGLIAILALAWLFLPRVFFSAQASQTTPPDVATLNSEHTINLLPVVVNGKQGYTDVAGNLVIPAIYDRVADSFCEGLAAVSLNGLVGYIDQRGKFVISPTFSQAGDFSNGRAVYYDAKLNKWGYIDTSGHRVIYAQYDSAFAFVNGKAKVGDKTIVNAVLSSVIDSDASMKWYYIDTNGNRLKE